MNLFSSSFLPIESEYHDGRMMNHHHHHHHHHQNRSCSSEGVIIDLSNTMTDSARHHHHHHHHHHHGGVNVNINEDEDDDKQKIYCNGGSNQHNLEGSGGENQQNQQNLNHQSSYRLPTSSYRVTRKSGRDLSEQTTTGIASSSSLSSSSSSSSSLPISSAVPGAYMASSRAFGERPAWEQRQSEYYDPNDHRCSHDDNPSDYCSSSRPQPQPDQSYPLDDHDNDDDDDVECPTQATDTGMSSSLSSSLGSMFTSPRTTKEQITASPSDSSIILCLTLAILLVGATFYGLGAAIQFYLRYHHQTENHKLPD